MIQTLGPLILLSTLTLSQTKGDGHISRIMVKPGDNFTMNCSVNNVYTLTIVNVTREDGASYLCQAGSSYKMSFFNTTLLLILGKVFTFSMEPHFFVQQIPLVQAALGDSVELNCSLVSKSNSSVLCPSKRSVYWFRSGAENFSANLLYTYEKQTEEQDQNVRCVYSLSTTVQDTDNETYYCAVATCGQVLFGSGTTVIISDRQTHLQYVCVALGFLLLCSAVINAVMFCRNRRVLHHKGVYCQ
ncbi:hypothetical protein WMY93_032076 [Mugilogobius chulae]|uniref:Ig-like domain-containing protein n=1 Tax=Mugilogobius chulae TaxID=88201 RepID=A0AAW0MCP6_9GOBI